MYYIVFFIGIILSMINDKKGISFKIFTVILSVLAFLRYGVGADYFAYNYLYNRLRPSLLNELKYGIDKQETLFRLIGVLFKNIGLSYQQYLIIIAIVNLYFIYKICKKYSKNPTFSLLIYFSFYYFVWTFSGLRQGLTLSIGVYYLLETLEDKNTRKFIFISILLSLIHLSAIILIPLYIGGRMNFNKGNLIIISIFAVFMSMIPMAQMLARFTWLPFMDRLMPYIDPSFSMLSIFSFKSLVRLIFLSLGLFYYKSYSKQDNISEGIINIYILSLLLYFILKSSEQTAARISIYGMFLNILILPNIYYMYKNKVDKLIFLSGLITLSFFYFSKELSTMKNQSKLQNSQEIMIPYTNIYNKEKHIFNNSFLYLLN